MEKNIIYYHAQTPVHMGSETDLGVIDMPIQREKHTNFPKFEASGIKGTLRDLFEKDKDKSEMTDLLFGPAEDGSSHAGNLRFTDAKILLFPVKSAKGIFAWITCPMILERFKKECNLFGIKRKEEIAEENTAINNENNISIDIKERKVILEEYTFKFGNKKKDENILNVICNEISKEADAYIKRKLSKDIFVVSDEEFQHFVEMSTEVNTRIRIGENGVVENGALFTEEYLPVETIMYGFVLVDGVYVDKDKKAGVTEKLISECKKNDIEENTNEKRIMGLFKKKIEDKQYIQLGGNMTLGKGITKVILGGA